jgi:proteasome component ECM29
MSSPTVSGEMMNDVAFEAFKEKSNVYLPSCVRFCYLILIANALKTNNFDIDLTTDWERKLDVAMENDMSARKAVRDYTQRIFKQQLYDKTTESSLIMHLQAALDLLVHATSTSKTESIKTFTNMLPLCPSKVASNETLRNKIALLVQPVFSNDPRTRKLAAQALGLLTSHPSYDSGMLLDITRRLLQQLKDWRNAVGESLNKIAGALVALSYIFSRTAYRRHATDLSTMIPPYLSVLFDMVSNSTDLTLREATYISISQLCMFASLTSQAIETYVPFNGLIVKILEDAKKGNTDAISALGYIGMMCEESPSEEEPVKSPLLFVESKLHSLHELREPETHFAIGEAICSLSSGWSSKALMPLLDVYSNNSGLAEDEKLEYPSTPPRNITITRRFEYLLKDCHSTKPSLNRASVIWLLCFLQFCGSQAVTQDYLRRCQIAFMRALSSRDSMVQETGARGLNIVYESGTQQLKDELVKDLVNLFENNSSKLSGLVSEDTELLDAGAITNRDGSSVVTYKDILSLASEAGDPTLVYRFMSLAANSSIWTTRAAFGRFGLTNIFSNSGTEGYLAKNPKLYVKLYRYR